MRSRIVLVESDTLLREALRAVIQLEPDFELVTAARSGAQCLEGLSDSRPDVVIADLASADGVGLEWLADLHRLSPQTRAVILSSFCTNKCVRAALTAGAVGYVLKDSPREELLSAIRTIAAGQRYFSKAVAALVLEGYLQPNKNRAGGRRLTPKESDVLRRVAAGESNQQIANALSISIKTVEKHRASLMRKLDLRDTSAITVFAVRSGLLPPKTFDSTAGEEGLS
ncbi:MAG: response regulator transcription factor [Sinobacteraceae bacterium]|nr:response regulator transcription factor [Nevskiaceae bacterium]